MLVDTPPTASFQLGRMGKEPAVVIDSAPSNAMTNGIIVSGSVVAQSAVALSDKGALKLARKIQVISWELP